MQHEDFSIALFGKQSLLCLPNKDKVTSLFEPLWVFFDTIFLLKKFIKDLHLIVFYSSYFILLVLFYRNRFILSYSAYFIDRFTFFDCSTYPRTVPWNFFGFYGM